MEEIVIRYIGKKPILKEPILIEGLPGIGNVGKLAIEHLIESIGAKKFIEIYSKDFPPQVFINQNGTIKLVNNELYFWKAKKKNQKDLILLTGDYQGLSSSGQYELADSILRIAKSYNVKQIFTLGGYGLGREVKEPNVLGAATSRRLVNKMKKYGVIFRENEPGGGIIGASGLLLGLGRLYGMEGVCLMGETPGYLVDPKSAKAVLTILSKVLNIEVDLTELERKAREIELIAQQLRSLEEGIRKGKEDLSYIG
ncbi:MAG: proteasome assembly chaperone family protein [Thermoplasmata archaeon]|nr:MAG: proteasome assembly chaperone family protein [Thermoplasmata archaeon]HDO69080.1 proteasome assembly chaperone family protein [Thermoplasmatales archaeon]HEX16995.1 proteasome assembly chaperone family protein [Thermoplasmatales archaeon]